MSRAAARARRHMLAVLVSSVVAVDAARAQTAPGAIHGVLVDTASRRLKGATIRIAGTETRRVTDLGGTFVFERMPPGSYRLFTTFLTRDYSAPPRIDTVVVRPGDTTHVRLTLRARPFKLDTLPPRFARGARPDTAPGETETLDLVARVGRFPRLRVRPPAGGGRELRFWLGGSGIPETLVRMRIDGERVGGEVIHYLTQPIPGRDADPQWRAFMDSVPSWLRSAFRCGPVATDTLHFPTAQEGYRHHLVAVCTSHYRHDLGWRELLRELEAHRVWTLPDHSELPSIGNIVSNGGGVTVEAWDGTRYHTYGTGVAQLIPAPEARDLDAIHVTLIRFLRRNHEISSPSGR